MQRNPSVDIAKGIGISLMVLGHSGVPEMGSAFIYMFHMPLFFILSGWCLKEKYLEQPKTFVAHRLKGLWWPYVKWSILFILLQNWFCKLHLYSPSYSYKGAGVLPYSLREMKDRVWSTVTNMEGAPQLLGGYWFLRELLLASLISWLLIKLIPVICRKRGLSFVNALWLALVTTMFSAVANRFGLWLPVFNISPVTWLAVGFFLAGFAWRQTWGGEFRSLPITLLLAAIVFAASRMMPSGMQDVTIITTVPYFACGIAGTIMTVNVSRWISKSITTAGNILSWIGRNTITILTWHFLSFKLVSLIIVNRYALNSEHLGEFPVIAQYAQQGWWIVYFLVAMAATMATTSINHWIHNTWLKL